LLGQGIEQLFVFAGKNIEFESLRLTNGGLIFVMLNSIIVSPIVEEALFRGIALRILSKYGRNFAIIVGAILFGLYHTNFLQFGHSFTVGIILGYITFRYSIKWAVVLHCIHNFVMIMIALVNPPWFFVYGFLAIFFLWAIGIIIVKREKIHRWIRKGATKPHAFGHLLGTPYLWAYIVLAILLAAFQTTVEPLDAVHTAINPNIPTI
jgi:acyl-CoA synthetase (AMP-forming)/AMP-acid ligase II